MIKSLLTIMKKLLIGLICSIVLFLIFFTKITKKQQPGNYMQRKFGRKGKNSGFCGGTRNF